MSPPDILTVPHTRTLHGHQRPDPYTWLEDPDDPAVLDVLEAENAYRQQVLAPLAPRQDAVFADLVRHAGGPQSTPPVQDGAWMWYCRQAEGEDYYQHCRTSIDRPEVIDVFLDENELAAGHEYFSLGRVLTSDDMRLLAYATDVVGDEYYDVTFLNLDDRSLVDEHLEHVDSLVCFDPTGHYLYYMTSDEQHRPSSLWRRHLGTGAAADGSDDQLVFHEPDATFEVDARRAHKEPCLFIVTERSGTTSWHALNLADPAAIPFVVRDRRDDVFEQVTIVRAGDKAYLLVRTDADHPNGALRRVPFSLADQTVGPEETIVPADDDVVLASAEGFDAGILLTEWRQFCQRLRVVDHQGTPRFLVGDPAALGMWQLAANEEFDGPTANIMYESITVPETTYRLDLTTGSLDLIHVRPVAEYDPDWYEEERHFARAGDGTQIPITLARRKGAPAGAGVLYGYGAYGYPIGASFAVEVVPLLDAGACWAVAHVRGGGEGGRRWWDAGRLHYKANTFDDYLACAHALVDQGLVEMGRLAGWGASAGGLLIAAIINRADPVIAACVAEVPFVDVVSTMANPELPLVAQELTEWGDPAGSEADYQYLMSYSPYDTVTPADHRPHSFLTCGLNDPRCMYYEPVKYIARLRTVWPADRVLVLHCDTDAGHFGASARYAYLERYAELVTFLLVATNA